ncbi:PrgI family protein [Paenibacillus abyssi]|uniref:PrgI family protein n=1 Tax=Paenibacillus abyssi TaxID=1340531 RepID=A0A917G1R3_9BACL|nr:PrgI family protein [Paenibacillus abyssi]GGG18140.1 hypothetical protein GCM10010916_38670 [Paenibacillus abyssi]
MGELVVPIDITGEEKAVLAIFSMRQFFLVAPAAVFTFVFLLWGGKLTPFLDGTVSFIIRGIIVLLLDLFVVACAFLKFERYEQYFSEFLITQIKYKKSQKMYY